MRHILLVICDRSSIHEAQREKAKMCVEMEKGEHMEERMSELGWSRCSVVD